MKFIILGAYGMFGSDIVRVFQEKGHTVIPFTSTQCDITSRRSLTAAFLNVVEGCDAVINCAAYTKVDNCEIRPKKAFELNALALENLADVTNQFSVPLVHFSTDYVFNGKKGEPYNESDIPDPISVYGESKLEGEKILVSSKDDVTIFRVQWLYGHHGHHFIQTIMNLAKEKQELHIVNDQWGTPSSTADLARCLESFLTREEKPDYGIYHLANQGYATWFDLAQFVVSQKKLPCRILPTSSELFKRPAPRPLNGRLNCDKFLALRCEAPLGWEDAVTQFLNVHKKAEA